MNYIILFGLLLGYPRCCIDQFLKERALRKRSIEGFVPCRAHAALSTEELEILIGRSLKAEPGAFREFVESDLTYGAGCRIYRQYNQGSFFKSVWQKAKNY